MRPRRDNVQAINISYTPLTARIPLKLEAESVGTLGPLLYPSQQQPLEHPGSLKDTTQKYITMVVPYVRLIRWKKETPLTDASEVRLTIVPLDYVRREGSQLFIAAKIRWGQKLETGKCRKVPRN